MRKLLIIGKLSNSFGRGFYIRAEIDGYNLKENCYYGYSLREAISRYRYDLKIERLHFEKIFI